MNCVTTVKATMTKKDFILIARTVNETATPFKVMRQIEKSAKYDQALAALRALAEQMCYSFKKENSKFDRAKFMKECGF